MGRKKKQPVRKEQEPVRKEQAPAAAQLPVGLEHVPDDVSGVIYTKLDVKEIAACRRVCKRIRVFIDSPGFARQWNREHREKPIYIRRQDEKCKAIKDLKHRFLDFKGTGHMKLMATTYALMCFLEGDRQLVVVNPLTGQTRKLPQLTLPILTAGIHFDRSSGEYTVIAAATNALYGEGMLYMVTYHSAIGIWVWVPNKNTTSSGIVRTSPIVWYEGAFYWTVGMSYKKQVIFKSDNWIDQNIALRNEEFGALTVMNDRLLLGNHQWWLVNNAIQVHNGWRPAKRYVSCYTDPQSGQMVLQMIGCNHECYNPVKEDIFTSRYYDRAEYCLKSDSTTFEFVYGLGI